MVSLEWTKVTISLDVNFCKDHRNKIEVPDPLAVEDLISSKLNNKRKLARLITQSRDIFFSNISEGTAFLLRGVTEKVTIPAFHALFAPTVGRQDRIMYQHFVSLSCPEVSKMALRDTKL